jgi:hypothetical protein
MILPCKRSADLSSSQTAFPIQLHLFLQSESYIHTLIHLQLPDILSPILTSPHSQATHDTMPPSVPYPPSTGVFATYPMQCHCAAIQYTIKLSPPLLESESEGKGIYTTLECDCSHCERKGIIACHPLLKDVEFTEGVVRSRSRLRSSEAAMRCDAMRCDAMRCDAMRCDEIWLTMTRCAASTGTPRRILLRSETESALGLQDLWFVLPNPILLLSLSYLPITY